MSEIEDLATQLSVLESTSTFSTVSFFVFSNNPSNKNVLLLVLISKNKEEVLMNSFPNKQRNVISSTNLTRIWKFMSFVF